MKRAAASTRLTFLAAGFGIACWAPLVPYAKARAGLNDASLGLLLLCLGAGSIVAMPVMGALSTRIGSKPLIIAGGIGAASALPFLSLFSSPLALAASLFLFGASLGFLNVAMNWHAVEVENIAARPMMSGFHALYSVGGFIGSGFMTALLSRHITPASGAFSGAAIVLALTLCASPFILQTQVAQGGPPFVLPRGPVLLLAGMALIAFLVEGAILDWSAVFLVSNHLVTSSHGGSGFMLFSISMTVGRLIGDYVIALFGEQKVFIAGGMMAVLGFALLLFSKEPAFALASFILIGCGAANIIPVLLRRAGNQNHMPSGLALASVTTAGYVGILIGPALVGFVAHATSLRTALALLTALFLGAAVSGLKATAS